MKNKTCQYLLNCLDSVSNSISIYDKDACLIFANKSFCEDYDIADRDAVYGLPIESILRQNGVSIHSIAGNRNRMKMMDVLKNGKRALDWEVRVTKESAPKEEFLVSNDMYPIIGEDGKTEGLVEITHSRQLDIMRTRRIVGLGAEHTFDDIIGKSDIMQRTIRTAKKYADNPFNVLINGESGVGKDLIAQAIHNESDRRRGPFVALNCASFPENLIESELFGYVSGAFTGASRSGQIGKIELADKGTLFLDEIGELPLHFQPKFLRVLETWNVTRIGSSQQISVNVRLLAATNRNLSQMVSDGLFREDLYYRLQVLNLMVPPLRDREEDVLLMAEYFLAQSAKLGGSRPKSLDHDACLSLLGYSWPGNVRELRNVINRATVLSKTAVITKEAIDESIYANNPTRLFNISATSSKKASITDPRIGMHDNYGSADHDIHNAHAFTDPSMRGDYGSADYGTDNAHVSANSAIHDAPRSDAPLEERLSFRRKQIDRAYAALLLEVMTETGDNKAKAASLLGVSRRTFYRMLEKYPIKP